MWLQCNQLEMVWFQNFLGMPSTRSFTIFWRNGRTKMLISDNRFSHLTIEVIEECARHSIRFTVVPQNAIHRFQLLDVVLFAPLKTHGREFWFMGIPNERIFSEERLSKTTQEILRTIDANSRKHVIRISRVGYLATNPQADLKRLPQRLRNKDNTSGGEIDKSLLVSLKKIVAMIYIQEPTDANKQMCLHEGLLSQQICRLKPLLNP